MKSAILNLKISLRHKEKAVINNIYGSCAVLLYHRVTTLQDDPQQLSVTPSNFDAQLNYLRKNDFVILSSPEFHHHLNTKKKFPKKSIFITFDDGYADNLLEALPILEKHKASALFYIATGTLNTANEFWWDAVERIFLRSNNGKDTIHTVNNISFNPSKLSKEERMQLYNELLPYLRRMASTKRDGLIAELANLLNSEHGRGTHRPLTFDELRKLADSSLVTIGAHTHLHPSLGALTAHEQLKEITLSKKILEQELSTSIKYFSYPFGTIHDYNTDTIKICRDIGFESIAANFPALTRSNTGTINFPRFLVRNWKEQEFSVNLKSFFKG